MQEETCSLIRAKISYLSRSSSAGDAGCGERIVEADGEDVRVPCCLVVGVEGVVYNAFVGICEGGIVGGEVGEERHDECGV